MTHLTDRQIEALALVSEESGEVVQVVGKILRHGLESYHPNNLQETNRHLLRKELTDVLAAINILVDAEIIDPIEYQDVVDAVQRKQRWLHFQQD